MDKIIMEHGSGGELTSELIESMFLCELHNEALDSLSDASILTVSNKIGVTTDSFVIYPHFFPGGDIGKLSVCGTVNDLIMGGCVPKALTLGVILEEDYEIHKLKNIVQSIKKTCDYCNINVVCGDTKVVEKGSGSGIYINTTGIGELIEGVSFSKDNIKRGDKVILTGNMGDHGIAILCEREQLLDEKLESDCHPLIKLIPVIEKYKECIRILRDPTRGGVATTLNEFVEKMDFSITINEKDIPMNPKISGVCKLLGIDPLYSANEGKAILIVDSKDADAIINYLREYEVFKDATIIGEVTEKYEGKVLVKNEHGGTRVVSKVIDDMLPRIC